MDTTLTSYKISLGAVSTWPIRNFTDPERRKWLIPWVISLHALSTLAIAGRVWRRVNKQAGHFGWDDALIVFSWAIAGAITGISIYGVEKAGLDRHVWDLIPIEWERAGLVAWIIEILFIFSIGLTKVSVVLFFRRLVNRSDSPWINRAIWSSIIFTVAYSLLFFFYLIFACKPVNASWTSLNITVLKEYSCVNRKDVDPWNGILGVFSDLYSLALPILIVGQLSIPFRRKMVLYAVFCCGLIVIGAGIARSIWLSKMYTQANRDLTWIGYELLIWTALEMQLAIICASVPAMKGFFGSMARKVTEHYGSREGGSSSNQRFEKNIIFSPKSASSNNNHNDFDDNWAHDSVVWYAGKNDHETGLSERLKKQNGGILKTEAFSVERKPESVC